MTIEVKSGNSLELPRQVQTRASSSASWSGYDLTGKTLRYLLKAKRNNEEVEIEFTEGATLALNVGQIVVTERAAGHYKLVANRDTMTLDPLAATGSLRLTDAAAPGFELELPDGSDSDHAGDVVDIWNISAEHQALS
jgi:hypothetical protein